MTFSLEENSVVVSKGLGRLAVSFNTSLEDGEQTAVVTMTVAGEEQMFYMTLTVDEVDYWISELEVHRWRQERAGWRR